MLCLWLCQGRAQHGSRSQGALSPCQQLLQHCCAPEAAGLSSHRQGPDNSFRYFLKTVTLWSYTVYQKIYKRNSPNHRPLCRFWIWSEVERTEMSYDRTALSPVADGRRTRCGWAARGAGGGGGRDAANQRTQYRRPRVSGLIWLHEKYMLF